MASTELRLGGSTPEQRERVIELVTEGKLVGEACDEVGITVTAFKSYARRHPDFKARYSHARGKGSLVRMTRKVDLIMESHEEEFLDLIRLGKNRSEAAHEIGFTGSQFRMHGNRDPDFNSRYEDALQEGRHEIQDRLGKTLFQLVSDGNWPALKAALSAYHPDFQWMRSEKVTVEGKVGIEGIVGVLSQYLPGEKLDELISYVEKQVALEKGDVIDALAVDD